MKILMVCDHYPLSPRVIKMRDSILKTVNNSEVLVYCWNRKNLNVQEDYVRSYNGLSEYGRFLKNLISLLPLRKNLHQFIDSYKPDYIHVIDFPMLTITSRMMMEYKIVYEVYDIKGLNNCFLNWIRENVERFYINKYVYKFIFASPYFHEYYKQELKSKKDYIVINNKPNRNIVEHNSNFMAPYLDKIKNKIVIGFIGNIRHKDLIGNLIQATMDNPKVIILLAGSGLVLEDIREEIENEGFEDKVVVTGRYEQDDLLSIYSICDLIWAAYPSKNLNVKYAVSNKYYESQIFGKKIIVSRDTLLGEKVVENNSGYSINPYDLKELRVSIKDILNDNENNKALIPNLSFWEDEERDIRNIYFDKHKSY